MKYKIVKAIASLATNKDLILIADLRFHDYSSVACPDIKLLG